MPAIYARAACVVLASLVTARWEEQFGMVLAEAMAAGIPIVTTTSGAIPEVVGDVATLVAPGDWLPMAIAMGDALARRPRGLDRPSAPVERVARFSNEAAAARIAAAYDRLLAAQ